MKPSNTNTLVTDGLYRYTRNPMYLGMLLLLSAYALWLGNPVAVVPLIMFVWYISRFQIMPEELALKKIFGQQFDEYTSSVRRWI